MKESYKLFYKKHCHLELKTSFHLYGIIENIDSKGVVISTPQKSSFIAWDDILTLIPTNETVN